MKRFVAAVVLAFTCAPLLGGCYEGWDRRKKDGGSGTGTGTDTPPPPGPKPLHHVLYQPIYLGPDALADTTCFPNFGSRDYRANEWQLRVSQIGAMLGTLAESVTQRDIVIGKGDCRRLEALRTEASLLTLPGYEVPEADDAGRKILHLKAVFWDEEPIISPPSVVTRPHWALWADLAQKGRAVRSANYFVVATSDGGYFTEWYDALAENEHLDGTAITDPDPTAEGIAVRAQTISADTEALAKWLVTTM